MVYSWILNTLMWLLYAVFPALIARFMGPTWGHLGPRGPRWGLCWLHELCYLGGYPRMPRRYVLSCLLIIISRWPYRLFSKEQFTQPMLIHSLALQSFENIVWFISICSQHCACRWPSTNRLKYIYSNNSEQQNTTKHDKCVYCLWCSTYVVHNFTNRDCLRVFRSLNGRRDKVSMYYQSEKLWHANPVHLAAHSWLF